MGRAMFPNSMLSFLEMLTLRKFMFNRVNKLQLMEKPT